ncbi:Cd27 binding protein (Siva) [Phytophthora infestans]|uniref:Cd27 binding protein (Siva) n=1 Tax=Phytophthora infestans TaxID=4787 RepID=A0A833TGU1_PHYIN|nr:Cd27 binding protein (Siva) [Phytophthora infestans]
MKRARDETTIKDFDMDVLGMTPPPSSLWASMSPWKPPHASTKRCRDRSVPVDAMSRMMSAAITNARIKKHSSIGRLFAGKCETPSACCAVCDNTKRQFDTSQMQRCSHCERQMGDCCRRECDSCYNVFCSVCSTLNCDEQFDRVLCLSCNEER